MSKSAKSEKEIVNLISGLIEKHEEEKSSVGQHIHGEICMLLALAKMELNRHLKKQVASEIFGEVFSLMDESVDKLKVLSQDLHPSLLKTLGLVKMLVNFNKKQEQIKGVVINFENLSPGFEVKAFEYKDQLNIFRTYSNILNYFFDTLSSINLSTKIYNDSKQLAIEFINEHPSTLKIGEDVIISRILKNDLQVIEALLLVLNAKIDERSDFINYIKISVPC